MHAAPARYVSVSELYSADEVELLLDEIRELEPTSCRGEDVQDFEIAGSGLDALGGGGGAVGGGGGAGGGRSPCGTELTERSWDSHAHYSRAPPPRPLHVAPLYCRLDHLLTLPGAVAFIITVCGVSACACVWAVVGVRAWRVPLGGRVRLAALGALSSALVHGALVFAHVSRTAALLPLDWRRVAGAAAAWSALSLTAGGALLLHAVLAAPEYRYAPPHVSGPFLAAAGLALCGACAAWVVVCVGAVACYRAGPGGGGGGGAGAGLGSTVSLGATYRAVPSAPPPASPPPHAPPAPPAAPQPSTSRDPPL